MSNPAETFIQQMKQPFRFRLFLLKKLPAAFFAGLRMQEMSLTRCVITVPFKWFTKNPFRSTYFACLAMAAEMSTGALALATIIGRKPAVSMLVVNMEANYYKKATGKTIFSCEEGAVLTAAVEKAIASGEAEKIKVQSTGRNEKGEMVAEFFITWSFKTKNKEQ